jgi:hypothetical protein
VPTREEITTAYHEAGHAVIARMLGIAVEYVTTLSDDRTNGVALTHSAAFLAQDADQTTRLVAITKDMVVSLAGPYAEMRSRPATAELPFLHGYMIQKQRKFLRVRLLLFKMRSTYS